MFNKIDIELYKSYMTKYPNGKTIFEALTETLSSYNKSVEDVNIKVAEGLLAIDAAYTTLYGQLTALFSNLETEFNLSFESLQTQITDDNLAFQNSISAQLAEKVQNFKIKNEVVNGDFNTNTSGWIAENASISTISGKMNIMGNGSSALCRARQENIKKPTIGTKIYIRATCKVTNSEAARLNLVLREGLAGTVFAEPIITAPLISVEYVLSAIGSININLINPLSLIVNHQYASAGVSTGKIMEVDKVLFVDLTNIFGTGNEPTKLEMDELMKVIPNGWWDGELSLTQKQFIAWQLNLIRKTILAVTALGGTIV